MWASRRNNNVQNVKVLLKHGADIHRTNLTGASVLHYAASKSDKNMIEFLLAKGCCINVTDCKNQTPLLWACEEEDNVENVKVLLQYGAQINHIYQEDGASFLHQAALVSDTSMIEVLIAKGLLVNIRDNDNETPLFYACQTAKKLKM